MRHRVRLGALLLVARLGSGCADAHGSRDGATQAADSGPFLHDAGTDGALPDATALADAAGSHADASSGGRDAGVGDAEVEAGTRSPDAAADSCAGGGGQCGTDGGTQAAGSAPCPAFDVRSEGETEACRHPYAFSKIFRGKSDNEYPTDFLVRGPEEVWVTGMASGSVDFGLGKLGPLPTETGVFLAGFDTSGAPTLSKFWPGFTIYPLLAGARDGHAWLSAINTGDLRFGSEPLATRGLVFAKLDTSGDPILIRVMPGGGQVRALARDADDVVAAGLVTGTLTFGDTVMSVRAGGRDGWAAKLDAAGDPVWAMQLICAEGLATASAIAVDAAHHVWIGGFFRNSLQFGPSPTAHDLIGGETDTAFVAKLDAQGELLFATTLEDEHGLLDRVVDIAIDSDGNAWIAAEHESFEQGVAVVAQPYVAKLSKAGEPLVARRFIQGAEYGTQQWPMRIQITASNRPLISGFHFGTANFSDDQDPAHAVSRSFGFLLELDASGAHRRSLGFVHGGPGGARYYVEAAFDSLWIAGRATSPVTLSDDSADNLTTVQDEAPDIVIGRYAFTD